MEDCWGWGRSVCRPQSRSLCVVEARERAVTEREIKQRRVLVALRGLQALYASLPKAAGILRVGQNQDPLRTTTKHLIVQIRPSVGYILSLL